MKELTILQEKNLQTMGEVLMVWRKKYGLSRYAVCKLTGLNPKAVKNIEEGKDVSLSTFLAYAELFLERASNPLDVMNYYLVYKGGNSSIAPRLKFSILQERMEFSKKKEKMVETENDFFETDTTTQR